MTTATRLITICFVLLGLIGCTSHFAAQNSPPPLSPAPSLLLSPATTDTNTNTNKINSFFISANSVSEAGNKVTLWIQYNHRKIVAMQQTQNINGGFNGVIIYYK